MEARSVLAAALSMGFESHHLYLKPEGCRKVPFGFATSATDKRMLEGQRALGLGGEVKNALHGRARWRGIDF